MQVPLWLTEVIPKRGIFFTNMEQIFLLDKNAEEFFHNFIILPALFAKFHFFNSTLFYRNGFDVLFFNLHCFYNTLYWSTITECVFFFIEFFPFTISTDV